MLETKTPQFDALLDEILNELVPHTRSCLDCKKNFNLEEKDITFFKIIRSPAPKLCPECRQRNRLAFANYSNIYKRKCNVPGHSEIMISPVAPIMPWITYDHETYYSDKWDPFSYGRDIEENKTFLDQFLSLLKVVPIAGVRRGANSINCDFSFYGKDMKDCYYLFGGRRSEDVMYSSSIYDSRHIVSSYFTRKDDLAFENIITDGCYKNLYAYFSSSCVECDFIIDCRNCQNCFGCVNLRNKSYCWFNEQLSREEYLKKREEIDLGSQKVNREYQTKFWNFVKTNPIRATRILKSENCIGNDIKESKNLYNVCQADNCENVRHSAFAVMSLKDSMDVNHTGGNSEKLYYCQNAGTKSSNIKFSFSVKESLDCEYMFFCNNCQNCFGCAGLKNASFCIFNKKYEPKEYWKLVDKIKIKMLEEGIYGEFFPMSFSPIAYNSSFSQIIYPMTEDEAKNRGLFWQPDIDVDITNLKTIKASDMPDNISEATEKICDLVIIGEKSGKPFRLIKREIDFYKQNKIPLPVDTPYQRMLERFKILNNFKIVSENCDKCNKQIESAYKKADGFRPYCEDCFRAEII